MKRSRANAATALADMSASITQVGQALAVALAPPINAVDPTPLRRSNAVGAVLRLEGPWLSKSQLVDFIDFIRADQTAADIYLALSESDVRKDWVKSQLGKLGVFV